MDEVRRVNFHGILSLADEIGDRHPVGEFDPVLECAVLAPAKLVRFDCLEFGKPVRCLGEDESTITVSDGTPQSDALQIAEGKPATGVRDLTPLLKVFFRLVAPRLVLRQTLRAQSLRAERVPHEVIHAGANTAQIGADVSGEFKLPMPCIGVVVLLGVPGGVVHMHPVLRLSRPFVEHGERLALRGPFDGRGRRDVPNGFVEEVHRWVEYLWSPTVRVIRGP